MVKKIEGKEIMTRRAAMLKYRTQYFLMAITEIVDGCDKDLGYVLFTTDTENGLYEAPKDEYRNLHLAHMWGVAAEPYPQIGNVVYHD